MGHLREESEMSTTVDVIAISNLIPLSDMLVEAFKDEIK
jgi:hypothetical protein